jgi:hypothetical protein
MNSYKKAFLYGFLTWLVPFVAAFAFYKPDGTLSVDIFLFKSIMIVVASAFGSFALVKYLKSVKDNFIKEGVLVGALWFATNIILDVIILIPMSKMSIKDYVMQIGLRYLMIPAISIGMGYVMRNLRAGQK